MNTISTGNPRKDWVYDKLEELRSAIQMDTFNLTRDKLDFLEMKLDEFKKLLDEKYGR